MLSNVAFKNQLAPLQLATPPRSGGAPRPGGAVRASGANYSTPRELYGGQDWNRTVDVMHGEAAFVVVLIFIERQGSSSTGHTNIYLVASYGGDIELCWLTMTKCLKSHKHLATSSTKSPNVLIDRAGRLSTKSHSVSKWFHALCRARHQLGCSADMYPL
jgi:hypothetical protein